MCGKNHCLYLRHSRRAVAAPASGGEPVVGAAGEATAPHAPTANQQQGCWLGEARRAPGATPRLLRCLSANSVLHCAAAAFYVSGGGGFSFHGKRAPRSQPKARLGSACFLRCGHHLAPAAPRRRAAAAGRCPQLPCSLFFHVLELS